MKILWITNTVFPAVCAELQIPIPFVGGWMYSSAESLINSVSDIDLGVASLYNGKKLKIINNDKIVYFLIPQSKPKHLYDKKLEYFWKQIKDQFNPDIIHLHGTEYSHGLAYINACGSANVVISIQGLVSVYERYFYGGISKVSLIKNITLRDLIRRDTTFQQRLRMRKRSVFEKEMIQKVNHIIGRTNWDKTHAWAINPKGIYHFCNETLRNEFYEHLWEYKKCVKHSIFISQANYPIKGLHQLIKALPLILNHYPDATVHIAGNDFIVSKNSLRLNGYARYIRLLIKKLGVANKLFFTGPLSEKEMCQKYLESNVFVCPSSIENSSNSIGEAQLLGVPCIASYVGGVENLITNKVTGILFRFEEIEMLANSVCQIFNDIDFTEKLSANGRLAAMNRHDRVIISQNLYSIYQNICKQ